jgi:hypothetical protein
VPREFFVGVRDNDALKRDVVEAGLMRTRNLAGMKAPAAIQRKDDATRCGLVSERGCRESSGGKKSSSGLEEVAAVHRLNFHF